MAILTVSREWGSGGEEIAKIVAEKLNYSCITRESIAGEIEEYGKKWLDWIDDLNEEPPGIWERFDRSYRTYISLVEHSIYRNAAKDNAVILGRGGNWLLKDIPFALRVRIVASPEDRSRKLAEYLRVDMEIARKQLKYRDRERSLYYHRAFGRDWTNPDDYDLTINTSLLGYDGTVELLLGQIAEKARLATPEAWQTMRRLELASRVKADILSRYHLYLPSLDIAYDGNDLVLRGVALLAAEKINNLQETAQTSAGNVPVRNEMVVGRGRW